MDTLDKAPSPLPDVTDQNFSPLAVIIQMGHDIRDKLTDYWATMEQLYTPFYSNTIKRDRLLHTLRFLHFADNRKETDKNNENYDRLWKM
jgi:hypothetical protein